MNRSAVIAIVGKPNTGKSTFLNFILGEKVSIVSDKPQTTRDQIHGILNRGSYQYVFVDTPGYHKPINAFDRLLNYRSLNSLKGVDVGLYFSDLTRPVDEEEMNIIKNFSGREMPIVLVLTKRDCVEQPAADAKRKELLGLFAFKDATEISSKTATGIQELLKYLEQYAINEHFMYETNQVSNLSDAFSIAELIREKAINILRQELPYALAVQIEKIEYDESKKLTSIRAAIIVEKDSQKPIVIGAGGTMIKRIGTEAREELELIYDGRVFLSLFVKVNPDWRNNEMMLKELGYTK